MGRNYSFGPILSRVGKEKQFTASGRAIPSTCSFRMCRSSYNTTTSCQHMDGYFRFVLAQRHAVRRVQRKARENILVFYKRNQNHASSFGYLFFARSAAHTITFTLQINSLFDKGKRARGRENELSETISGINTKALYEKNH